MDSSGTFNEMKNDVFLTEVLCFQANGIVGYYCNNLNIIRSIFKLFHALRKKQKKKKNTSKHKRNQRKRYFYEIKLINF